MKYTIMFLLTLTVSSCSTMTKSPTTYRQTSSALNDFSIFYLDASYTKNGVGYFSLEPHYTPGSLTPGGKVNIESERVIVDLSNEIGADPKDKDANDGRAICDGEEKTSGWYVALLASAQVDKLSFEDMKAFVDNDVVNNCQSMGGEIIKVDGNEISVISESKGTRVRQKGAGTFSKWVPEKRNCYHYKVAVKCDMTGRKKEILEQIELIKEIDKRSMKH